MSTIFEKAQRVGPHTHVLIVGVDAYDHAEGGGGERSEWHLARDLIQLTSPSQSALALAEWFVRRPLNNPVAPLGSVELLVSDRGYIAGANPATFENVQAAFLRWFKRSDENEGNVAIFYFCGHGVHTGEDQYLLFQDFGRDPEQPWASALDISGTMLSVSTHCRAKSQIYFLDTCRTIVDRPQFKYDRRPETWPKRPAAMSKAKGKTRYMLQPAGLGQTVWAYHSQPSPFCQALIQALQGLAAVKTEDDQWVIGVQGLKPAIQAALERCFDTPNLGFEVYEEYAGSNRIIHTLIDPPIVWVRLRCLPPEALKVALFFLEVESSNGTSNRAQLNGRATVDRGFWETQAVADLYWYGASFADPRFQSYKSRRPVAIAPPIFPVRFSVTLVSAE